MTERITMRELRALAKEAFGPEMSSGVDWSVAHVRPNVHATAWKRGSPLVYFRLDAAAPTEEEAKRLLRDALRGIVAARKELP